MTEDPHFFWRHGRMVCHKVHDSQAIGSKFPSPRISNFVGTGAGNTRLMTGPGPKDYVAGAVSKKGPARCFLGLGILSPSHPTAMILIGSKRTIWLRGRLETQAANQLAQHGLGGRRRMPRRGCIEHIVRKVGLAELLVGNG